MRTRSLVVATVMLAALVAVGATGAGSAAGTDEDERARGAPPRATGAKVKVRSRRLNAGKHVLVRTLKAPRKGPELEDDAEEGAERQPDDPKDKVDPPDVPPMPDARAAATTIPMTILRSTVVPGAADTTVAEPTAANDRNAIVATGNHFIALSRDNGLTYPEFLDTNALFPTSLRGKGFGGDATAISIPRDGYALTAVAAITTPDSGGNAIAFAVFDGSRDELTSGPNVDEQDVCTFSFSAPSSFDFKDDTWLDYPQLAMTEKWLYVTARAAKLTNGVIEGKGGGAYRGEVIWRIEIDDIEDECDLADPSPAYQWWIEDRENSVIALVSNADTTMFMAQHVTSGVNDKLRLWKWTDSSGIASGPFEANIADWPSRDKTQKCKLNSNKDRNPCDRNDGRLHVGYRVSDTVGWVWTSAQGTEGENFDWPHLRVVTFDTSDLTDPVQDRPLYENTYGVTYPAVGVNGAGRVAMVYYRMGGDKTLDARAWITSTPRDWSVAGTNLRSSTSAPTSNTWGDYSTVRDYNQCPAIFLAGIHSMQGGGATNNVEVRYPVFGPEGEGCPDYTVEDLGFLAADDFSRTIDRGEDILISGTTRNTGFKAPGISSRTQFWLSKNPTHNPNATDPNDIKLQTEDVVPSLAPEAGDTFEAIRATVPADTPGGEYYLIACADGRNQFDEINDDDCVSEPEAGTNGAPLTVKFVFEKRDLAPGTFNVTDSVAATGGSARTKPIAVKIDATGFTAGDLAKTKVTVQASPTKVAGPKPVELSVASSKVKANGRGAGAGRRTQTREVVLSVPKRIRAGSRWFLRVCVRPPGLRNDDVTRNDCRVSKRAILLRRR
jgi:hypothetical protein